MTDGANPIGGLVQAADGDFYGTTAFGGAGGYGTVFRMTPLGSLTTVHSFDGGDGANPSAELMQATDGNLYGTTAVGGAYNEGTIFAITPQGSLTTLHSFDGIGGASPYGGLVQDTDGSLYGTTYSGGFVSCGSALCGTVFRLSLGLQPFLKTLPASGKEGAPVKILGTNLTGATAVSFHGTAAVFTVVSGAEISTRVPVGATSGEVKVTTATSTLSSNVPFEVRP